MHSSAFLPHLKGFDIASVHVAEDQVDVEVVAVRPQARCPLCRQWSTRVHSRYRRTVADLPWSGLHVTLSVLARRFRCRAEECPRRIFCERLPDLVAAYARRTFQLAAALAAVGFALGGRPGTRLARKLHLPTSRMTLLRLVRATPDPAPPATRILGVDEWAFRRGRRFGTILVDLERHCPVDLLPEATAASLATWLRQRSGVEVISRDRGGAFADGARQGAPEATQVADRFHLLKNLGEAVERVLRRHADLLRCVPAPGAGLVPTEVLRPDRRASRERTRREMHHRFAVIRRSKARGMSIAATARALGLHRHTVEKYWALEKPPERRYTQRRASALAPFEAYLQERWRQGQPKARGLWKEIVAQGYAGAYENVARYVAALKHLERSGEAPPPTGLTPRQAVALTLLRPRDKTPAEQQAVANVKALHPALGDAIRLLERFARLIRHRTDIRSPEDLDRWMIDAAEAAHPELTAFVVKLKQDRDAVRAAFELPYSQGQTEGQITRLKALKRAMYGRANFDLLRKRFLVAG